jgi:two-component system, NtrC family, response regulator HydG
MTDRTTTPPLASDPNRVLITVSDPGIEQHTRRLLEQSGYLAETCRLEELPSMVAQQRWPLILLFDESRRAREVVEQLADEVKAGGMRVAVLALRPSATEAMAYLQLSGVMDYCAWPLAPTEILALADRARREAGYAALLEKGVAAAPATPPECVINQKHPDGALIGGSPAMLELSKQMVKVGRASDLRVFLSGETGTGKEVVARHLHRLSALPGPFKAINCAATVETLLESTLFGHEKGAFTGAHAMKKGLWEEAGGGTLFLDEITETPPAFQAKLLRVLQEGVIQRVGSNQEIKVTARVIAASNRDVERAMKDGLLRPDLFYRLGQVIHLPPLRRRGEDIPRLIEFFRSRAKKQVTITPDALAALCAYDWPGNVRELEGVIQKLITFSDGFIMREDVSRHIPTPEVRGGEISLPFWREMSALRDGEWPTVQEVRNWYVLQAWSCWGRESVVARNLGIDPRTVRAIVGQSGWQDGSSRRAHHMSEEVGAASLEEGSPADDPPARQPAGGSQAEDAPLAREARASAAG